ncbi:MAG: hypothetical protein KBT03_00510 [Bacteroidales bacterium]|nr:hypothetical protein [Candidatus Scybalousia scybalohippi]
MAAKSILSISSNPILNFISVPTEYFNRSVIEFNLTGSPSSSYEPYSKYELMINSNPAAFSYGKWYKETQNGATINFYFENGSRLYFRHAGTSVERKLYNSNGTILYDFGTSTGSSSTDNHRGVMFCVVDKTLKHAYFGSIFDWNNVGASNWRGSLIAWSIEGRFPSAEQLTNIYNCISGSLPPGFLDDTSKTGGGKGDWDDDGTDDIDLPNIDDLNSNAINGTQFMTLYQLTQSQLNNLGNALWSHNIMNALANTAIKPMDYILSFCMLPVNVGGTEKEIKAGFFTLSDMTEGVFVNGKVVEKQYVRVDCGELDIKEKWGSAIDYLTDLSLYLPFIGIVKLSPQDVMRGKIKIIYTVDLLTGNCIATVKVIRGDLNSVLYNFTGNCCSSYPISSRDFSSVFGSVINASASVMGAATATKHANSLPDTTKRQRYLKEKATERAVSAMEGAGMQATNNLLAGNFYPDVVRCGTMSANVGFMGIKKPFLIISRLKQSLPADFGKHAGYMCNVTKKLSDCKGFTQVRFIHLDGIIATNTEKNELDSLLKEGVIIK